MILSIKRICLMILLVIYLDNLPYSISISILNDHLRFNFHSFSELSRLLVNYLKLCLDGKFDEVRHHLAQLPNCVNWLDPSFKITSAPKDEDSDSDSESGSDEDMDVSSDDEAPTLVKPNQRQRNKPQTDEDGWTTIPSRRR